MSNNPIIHSIMYGDLVRKEKRLGWFQSKFARVSWLDIATGVVITGVLTVMVANLAYMYGFKI